MTEKSNLEDDLFDVAPTRAPEEQAFLNDVLGPEHGAVAPVAKSETTNQEQYDNARKPNRRVLPKSTVHHTEGGKEIHVDIKESGKYFIKFVPGGELPKELKGEYTQETLAHTAIRNYLANK